MKIYLANISFKDFPIVWTYDPSTDVATCDLEILDSLALIEKDYLQEDILDYLKSKEYPFITITNNVVSIPKLSHILNENPLHPIPYLNKEMPQAQEPSKQHSSPKSSPERSRKAIKRSTSTLSSMKNGVKGVFGKDRSISTSRIKSPTSSPVVQRSHDNNTEDDTVKKPKKIKKKRTSTILRAIAEIEAEQHKERYNYTSIALDKLILFETDNVLWRTTLAMQGDFLEKVEQEQRASSFVFLTANLFQKQLLLKKNLVLYPARKVVLDQLGEMLEHLNEVFQSIAEVLSPYHRAGLYYYFQEAVESAMSVSPIISQKTEFESLPAEEFESIFKGNAFWQQANHLKALQLRYQIKTAKLTCIVKNSWRVDVGVEFPKDHPIDSMLRLFLSTKIFEKLLYKQQRVPKEHQTICSQIMSFNNKVIAFCEVNSEYKTLLKTLKSENQREKLTFEDFFHPDMVMKVSRGTETINQLLKYQALTIFKNRLNEEPELQKQLQACLKQINHSVFSVTQLEVESKQTSEVVGRMIADERPLIEGYYSLKSLIANILTNTLQQTTRLEAYQVHLETARKATRMIIIALSLSPPAMRLNDKVMSQLNKEELKIATWVKEILGESSNVELTQDTIKVPTVARERDSTIYLSPPWVEKISSLVKEVIEQSDMKRGPQKKKNTDHFCEYLVKQVIHLYLSELNLLKEPERQYQLQ
ncbi:hypothetical protein [Legionella waltersii]|uniref:Uncharacterized protein n=1 Tax=Legionella waltersii TaxID=66969 RepID=A0A0W1A775_9GAMM|nr:hypothetical protein [Legionella waltersii]KTD77186.1 hypothetical protein Lwal_1963 [Legionella waltersii]SNV11315.1 Uncharacterised protein [Legionella waltersii]